MRNHLADQVLDHEMLNRVRIHVSYVNFSNMNLTLCDSHKMKAHDLQLGIDFVSVDAMSFRKDSVILF